MKKKTDQKFLILQKKYPNISLSLAHINDIFHTMRIIIAYYLKDTYFLENIAAYNGKESISIDESLFTDENNEQIWVAGLINIISRAIRSEKVEDRTVETMKKIIKSHIPNGNIITTDTANCYSWQNNSTSGYTHHVHNLGQGDFAQNIDSTSHIEQLWHNLKAIIKKIYYFIPGINFILFLKEAE